MESNSITSFSSNPLSWYTLTETTNSILNELIAYTGREQVAELQKKVINIKRINALWELFEEINAVNRDVDNFKSADRMQQIINIYGPHLRKVNNGANWSERAALLFILVFFPLCHVV